MSRVGAALLALLVAAGGLVLVSRAFRADSPIRPAARIENGVLAFRSSEVWVVNPDGSGLRRLNRLECINDACDVAEGSLVLTPWEWSPDGTRLACYGYAYHRADSGGADYAIFVMSADGSEVTDLTSDLPELEGTSQGNPHWSPDGTRLAFDNDDGIYVVNADGFGVVKVARGAFPTWSPDGTRIAFVTGSEGGGSEIRVVNADGTGERTVTGSGGFGGLPAWSPDGSRIAYVASVKGEGQQLYVVNPDGTDEIRLTDLRSDGMGGYSPTWSPDGNIIAIEVFEQGNWNIYLVPADGSVVRQLTDFPGDENRPTWAPDGTKIAFMGSSIASSEGENSGSFDVHVIDPDGTDLQRLTDGAGAAPGALTWQPIVVSEEAPTPTPSPSPSVEAVVAATTTVGEDGAVRSVVYGEGAVWVAVTGEGPSGPDIVLRIDPETDEIVATIPVDAVPGWAFGGAGMTIGAGSVWVTGSVEDPSDPPIGIDAVLVRIDPVSNEVSATIPLEGGKGGDVVVDENGVWVAVGNEEQGELVRVDPATNEIVARIPIPYKAEPYQDLRGVLAMDGVILVSQLTFENGRSAITAVDSVTNQVLGTAVSSIGPLVAWHGEVWTDNGYQLLRIDPRTGKPLGEAVQLPEALAAGLLVADDRGLWFLGYDGRTGAGPRTLSLFDPETGEVQTFVDVPGIAPNAMAVGPTSVWVLDYHRALTRIALD